MRDPLAGISNYLLSVVFTTIRTVRHGRNHTALPVISNYDAGARPYLTQKNAAKACNKYSSVSLYGEREVNILPEFTQMVHASSNPLKLFLQGCVFSSVLNFEASSYFRPLW